MNNQKQTPLRPRKELTDWYPADVKPVRVGVYEACMEVFTDRFGTYHIEFGFAKWDGNRWGPMHTDPSAANELITWATGSQRKGWRGLKEPAK